VKLVSRLLVYTVSCIENYEKCLIVGIALLSIALFARKLRLIKIVIKAKLIEEI
jgi:hypothetical protein